MVIWQDCCVDSFRCNGNKLLLKQSLRTIPNLEIRTNMFLVCFAECASSPSLVCCKLTIASGHQIKAKVKLGGRTADYISALTLRPLTWNMVSVLNNMLRYFTVLWWLCILSFLKCWVGIMVEISHKILKIFKKKL